MFNPDHIELEVIGTVIITNVVIDHDPDHVILASSKSDDISSNKTRVDNVKYQSDVQIKPTMDEGMDVDRFIESVMPHDDKQKLLEENKNNIQEEYKDVERNYEQEEDEKLEELEEPTKKSTNETDDQSSQGTVIMERSKDSDYYSDYDNLSNQTIDDPDQSYINELSDIDVDKQSSNDLNKLSMVNHPDQTETRLEALDNDKQEPMETETIEKSPQKRTMKEMETTAETSDDAVADKKKKWIRIMTKMLTKEMMMMMLI